MEEMICMSSVDVAYVACERVIFEAFAIASLLDFVNKGFPWLVQWLGLLSDLLDRNLGGFPGGSVFWGPSMLLIFEVAAGWLQIK